MANDNISKFVKSKTEILNNSSFETPKHINTWVNKELVLNVV